LIEKQENTPIEIDFNYQIVTRNFTQFRTQKLTGTGGGEMARMAILAGQWKVASAITCASLNAKGAASSW